MKKPSEIMHDEETLKGKFLTFIVGNDTYGLEIRYVKEINEIQKFTEIPEMPVYIKGIINLRGKIIPLMDMRLLFGKESKEYDDRTCVVVIDFKSVSVGLIVDVVTEVLNISDDSISKLPRINRDFSSRFVKNIGKVGNEVVLLLDCDSLISRRELPGLEAFDKV